MSWEVKNKTNLNRVNLIIPECENWDSLKARMADETEHCPKTAVLMKPITIPFCRKASNLTEAFYRLVHTHCLDHSVGKLQSLLKLLIVWFIHIVSIILSESFKAYWHFLLFGSYTLSLSFCQKASKLTDTSCRLVDTHCLDHSVGKLQSLLTLLTVRFIHTVSIILSESFEAYWHFLSFVSHTLSLPFCRKASKLIDTSCRLVHTHCLYHSVGKLQSLLTLLIVRFIHTVRLVTRVITRPTNCPS